MTPHIKVRRIPRLGGWRILVYSPVFGWNVLPIRYRSWRDAYADADDMARAS